MSYSKSVTMVAALALLTAALAGCTSRQQSNAQSTAAPVAQSAAAQPTTAPVQPAASAAADATAQPQSAATVAAAASNAALASSDGEKPGTKLVLNSLVRSSGDTLTLRFTVVNNSDNAFSTGSTFHGDGYEGNGRDASGVHLIDTVSKKKYFPLADTDHTCVCSQNVEDIVTKTQTAFWVKFPAPPASVKKIVVQVPHFIPLDDVPIAQ